MARYRVEFFSILYTISKELGSGKTNSEQITYTVEVNTQKSLLESIRYMCRVLLLYLAAC